MTTTVASFSELQLLTGEWRYKNFPPDKREAFHQMMGVVEETGEIAHALLKLSQDIRGNEDLEDKLMDSIGDLVIYLCGVCDARDLTLFECVNRAWLEVKDRDWVKYPDTGRPPEALTDLGPQDPHNEVPHFERGRPME